MPTSQYACDEQRLRLFLDHQLDAPRVAALENHLDACQVCCEKIEELATGRGFWSVAGKRLNGLHQQNSTAADTPMLDSPPAASSVQAYLKTWLAPTDDPKSLGRLGCYEIVGVVGIGGMGIVLKGFDPSLARFVAIKVLASHLASIGSARKRFAREARAAAAVVHENVLAIHSIDHWNDLPYFVMPYVRGESLEQRIKRQGPLETIEILRIAIQISAGLAAAHAQGLVHRDVKPANVLLDQGSERLKISDFGLARTADDASLTQSGSISGTPLFMSPEQARGELVCHRSDIFSLGSLLYTLCTGHPPFRAETPYGVLRRISDDSPKQIQHSQPAIPFWLSGIVEKMMHKDANQRFASTDELTSLFRSGLNFSHHPTETIPPELAAFLTRDTDIKRSLPSKTVMASVALATAFSLAILAAGLLTDWTFATRSAADNLASHATQAQTSHSPPDDQKYQLTTETPPTASVAAPKFVSPDLISAAPTQPAAIPVKKIDSPKYCFLAGQKFGYLCELTIARPEFEMVIEGTFDFTTTDVLEDGAELNYKLDLSHRISRQDHSTGTYSPWQLNELESELSILAECETEGRIKVDYLGNVVGRSNPSILPGGIGPFADWVFPVIPLPSQKTYKINRELKLSIGSSKTLDFRRPFENSFEEIFVTRESKFSLPEKFDWKKQFAIQVTTLDFQVDDSEESFSNKISGAFLFDTILGANLESKIEANAALNNQTTKAILRLQRVDAASKN